MTKSVIVAIIAVSAPLGAQWITYPTAGVPKTASGQPNLNAPAPRTADGKPDLSGMWEADPARVSRPCPTKNCEELRTSTLWLDFGQELAGGLPYQPWAADAVKQRKLDNGKDDPTSWCLPLGVPRLLVDPEYRKIVQVPGLVVILTERNASYRQIFTDGRPLPEDPQPSWNGYSTGKWDGRHLGGGDRRSSRRNVARPQRKPAHRCRKNNRAVSARELRKLGNRRYGERSESLHQAVDGQGA